MAKVVFLRQEHAEATYKEHYAEAAVYLAQVKELNQQVFDLHDEYTRFSEEDHKLFMQDPLGHSLSDAALAHGDRCNANIKERIRLEAKSSEALDKASKILTWIKETFK